MKTIFIPSKYVGKIELGKIKLDELPKKIGIVTTAQFIEKAAEIKKYLEENGKVVLIGKGNQKQEGQVLGCDSSSGCKIKDKVDSFLYIGSGSFHPIGVFLSTKKDVFCFNPATSLFSRLDKSGIEKYEKRKKAGYVKFLHAGNIGIMISVKPGQCSYKKANEIKKKIENKGKKCFVFVFDTLDGNEIENFPFIDLWINTACPRMSDDEDKKNVIDMSDLDL
ncbi:hypothetical protein CL615_01165 [archaeon]|jgi:2-(3-amino-3-carboxypropyl)histidine synthase|nr:hypothetical protein [archaeon]MDP6547591.1 diphthamide synthesis protein [Candidatus Woesearchaeota archaeon]|tara:strand:+ start:37910 stop:38575 length:666 start_codon:yes stop_codon:yes gene_type:complete